MTLWEVQNICYPVLVKAFEENGWGAIADPTTAVRARAFGFDPEKSLRTFNACPLFTALGDAVVRYRD